MTDSTEARSDRPLLELEGVWREFATARGRVVTAVRDVSLRIFPGEAVGLVGESGSGKSTIARLALKLIDATRGRVRLDGQDLAQLPDEALRTLRGRMQMVFQDPWGALNPRHTVGRLLEEPLLLHAKLSAGQRRARATELAERVQLSASMLDRYPGQLSGGQLQRVCIARALATDPDLLVLDEPTSSLDVSVRADILGLLDRLRRETGVAMLFISHDIDSVQAVCDRVVVLYLGCELESGPIRQVLTQAAHPYTRALLSARLPIDPEARHARVQLEGEIPSPLAIPPGCPFASRCPTVIDDCKLALPGLTRLTPRPLPSNPSDEEGASATDPEWRARCIRIESDLIPPSSSARKN
jgi:oligopeptide/dipeptide ABC transporter ATP-binding protein